MEGRIRLAGLVVLAMALGLAGAACNPQASITPSPTATTSAAAPTATRTLPATPTQAPAPAVSPTPTVNITVTSPIAGTTISNPVRIAGKARVFEAALMVSLKDGRGNVLGTMPVMANMGAPEWGDYTANLTWDASTAATQDARIEAYTHSARDGSVIDVITVNVMLPPRPASSVASPGALPSPARTASPAASPSPVRTPTAATSGTPSPGPTRSP